ncbi:RHS repeat-associated core domain-containing protein [Serratia marcescens]|uniref:RHS repeat-associated core domain-containing protein n=1 Tax=Serratia marcescens TaxID=615 RepID=UPI00320491FC
MSTSLYGKTPSVTVLDNRGLTVRDIAYHRHPDTPDITSERITRHQYDARGFLMQSADPRMHDAGLANFSYRTDLTGSVLRSQGADAGTVVSLNDAAGRSFLAVSNISTTGDGPEGRSQAITRTWQYEDATLPGRPLSITEQVTGETARITERFVWAGNSAEEKALNLAGQPVSHYDTAGLTQTDSVALTGVPLSVTRRLLKDADNPDAVADWKGTDASAWNDLLDAETYTTLSTADATGVMLTTTDAKGNLQRVAYDVAGLLSGSWLTLKGGKEQTVVKSLTYSAARQKLREEHGNGVVTTYTYEAGTQRLTGIKTERPAGHASGAKVLQDLRYEYDPVGNVLKITNDAEETRFWRNQKVVPENAYVYDSLYQLVSTTGREMANAGQQGSSSPSATVPLPTDSSAFTSYTRSYTYDEGGNLTQIRHSAPATGNSYTTDITVSDKSNRAVLSTLTENAADVDALFTAGGQQSQLQPGQSLVWTPRGELLKVTPVVRDGGTDDRESYRYDAGSQRLLKVSEQKTGNSTQTQRALYLPGLELRTTASGSTETESLQVITAGEAGQAQVRVLHWESGRPAEITGDQVRYSYDNLTGSSGLELDGDGNVISMEEYYPYGGTAVWTARSAVEAEYKTVRYSGKERDATGLYYYGYRYYQPWAGRWLSADPAGTVDGLNLFRMVRNNPVSMKDKDGRVPTISSIPNDTPLTEIFQWGDILYGLDKPREKSLSALSSAGFKRKEAIKPPTKSILKSIRQSFRKVKEKTNIIIQNDITNAVWDVGKPKEYSNDKTIHKQLNDPERAIQFRNFISSHEKYNVIVQDESTKLMAEPWKAMQLGVPLWKRTSKAGLEFQLLVRKKTLHFMTDLIGDDIGVVISKEGHGASITSSELRWLYRHRDLPEVRSNLIFYREGKKISHEEIFGKNEWKNYHPKNQYKQREKKLSLH